MALIPRLVGVGYLIHIIVMMKEFSIQEESYEFPFIMSLLRTIELVIVGFVRCNMPNGFSNWSKESDLKDEKERSKTN